MPRIFSVIPAKAGIHLSRFVDWIPVCTGISLVVVLFFNLSSVYANTLNPYYQVNQTVCDRFEVDTARLAAIMEELRRRKGLKETRVAYGNIKTQTENADYYVTYAAEAIAYQRAKNYSSKASLKSDLVVLQNKILTAKAQVKKALDEKN